MNTTISTTIPTEIYEQIKKKGYKLNELLILGFKAKDGGDLEREQNARIAQLEENIRKYQTRLSVYFKMLEDMRTDMEEKKKD